jgi:hypothetical protein
MADRAREGRHLSAADLARMREDLYVALNDIVDPDIRAIILRLMCRIDEHSDWVRRNEDQHRTA